MKDLAYDPDEPIAALATPWGESALAVVRTSGAGSIERIAEIFSDREGLERAAGNTLLHGSILDRSGGQTVDDVVLAVFRAPRSYTGQDSVEVFCHGSIPGVQGVLAALKGRGFRDAGPGEFTLRAFLNKKMDLTRAEAVQEIVRAKTREAQSLALHRLAGAVERRINGVKERLKGLAGTIEIQLDYPEDEVPGELADALPEVDESRRELEGLLATYRTGRIYQEGVRVALCGRTNAGKSSLFNALLREERSIVSEVHGTTRDYIESWITIGGVPVSLFDTAGLRSPSDVVESEGIRRSETIIENADLLIYLVDAMTGVTAEDEQFIASVEPARCLVVWNKIDRGPREAPAGYLPVSVATGEGLERITAEIVARALPTAPAGSSDVVIDSLRQKELLEQGREALRHVGEGIESGMPADAIALDLRDALDALGEITGEVTSADILNTMFASFCVGK